MPSYTTVDLKLSHLAEDRVRLGATLSNILDRHYYSYAIRNSAGDSFNAYPQAGRTILLSVDARF
jgi:outer membrane receptor protein involved in Fe transport